MRSRACARTHLQQPPVLLHLLLPALDLAAQLVLLLLRQQPRRDFDVRAAAAAVAAGTATTTAAAAAAAGRVGRLDRLAEHGPLLRAL